MLAWRCTPVLPVPSPVTRERLQVGTARLSRMNGAATAQGKPDPVPGSASTARLLLLDLGERRAARGSALAGKTELRQEKANARGLLRTAPMITAACPAALGFSARTDSDEHQEQKREHSKRRGVSGLGTSAAHGSKHDTECSAFVVLLPTPINQRTEPLLEQNKNKKERPRETAKSDTNQNETL